MRISETTINQVKEATDIIEVIGELLPDLKQKGASYEACCPFHGEKTPSFRVNVSKQFYKCFGCGRGGDAITFVRDHERLTYTEALKWLADKYKIEWQTESSFTKEEWEKKISREQEISGILSYAEQYYHKTLLEMPVESDVWQELSSRGYDQNKVIQWRLGYAPDQSKNITTTLLNKGWMKPAVEIGVIKEKSGICYDFFRHRIIIPLHDRRGNLIGFSGRRVGKDDQYAKYMNPPESDLYQKKEQLFGLWQAEKHIKSAGFAYQVEGNFDVISMHLGNIENTVGPGGTALTIEQAKLLRKITDKVVIVGDGDKAGVKAMLKNIDIYLALQFRVEVCELPEGMDPDSYIRKHVDFTTILNTAA